MMDRGTVSLRQERLQIYRKAWYLLMEKEHWVEFLGVAQVSAART